MSHLTHTSNRSLLPTAVEMKPGILPGLDIFCRRIGSSFTTKMEVLMKLVRIINKFRPEKSLKAYAWYGWI